MVRHDVFDVGDAKTSKREILWIITRYKGCGVYHLWNGTLVVGLLLYKLRGPKIKCSLGIQFWLQCCRIITNTTTLGLPFRTRIISYAQIKIRHKTTDMINFQWSDVISQTICVPVINGNCWGTILAPCHRTKSRYIIWRLDTRRRNLRVPDLKWVAVAWVKTEHHDNSPSNGHQSCMPYEAIMATIIYSFQISHDYSHFDAG